MHRRNVLKALSVGALGAYLRPLSQQVSAEESGNRVKTVYVLYKCHLDVGFTDTEQGVMRTYFNDYFPRAMEIAEKEAFAQRLHRVAIGREAPFARFLERRRWVEAVA